MKERLILSASLKNHEFINSTKPFMQEYAKKTGADLIIIEDSNPLLKINNDINNEYILKVKLVFYYLSFYKNILWLDDTCIIKTESDLFDYIDDNYIVAFNEESIISKYNKEYIKEITNYSINSLNYIDTDVVVYNYTIQQYLSDTYINKYKKLFLSFYPHQAYINYIIQFYQMPCVFLDKSFDEMSTQSITGPDIGNSESKIYHISDKKDKGHIFKIAVVSAYIKIDMDKLDKCNPINKIPGFDYIMFVDKKYEEIDKLKEIWDIRTIELPYNKGVYYTKHIKWLTHLLCPDYDYIIWVDCLYSPTNPIELKKYIDMMQETNISIAMRTQPLNSVMDDINWCILNKRITNDMKDTICKKLKENNFSPEDPCQTFWSSAIIKDNKDTRLHEMSKELIGLILNIGYRDQHWLPYLISKYNIPYNIIPDDTIIKTSGVYFSKNYLASV